MNDQFNVLFWWLIGKLETLENPVTREQLMTFMEGTKGLE